jgi:BCD family chlorophyll transporter-like MFS transporter
MTTRDFTTPTNPLTEGQMPHVSLLVMFRLGLFNLGLGLMAVLTLAVLNRVMIGELGIPGSVSAGVLALAQVVAPARVWFGQLSDAKSLLGYHRTGYVRLGAVALVLAVFAALQTVWQLGQAVQDSQGWSWNGQILGWTAVLAGFLILYGLATSASSTPFTALLVDISDEGNRSKIVAVVWSMLMVGIVIGGITGSVLLKNLKREGSIGVIPLEVLQRPINSIFILVPLIVLALAFIATWGVEKRYSRYRLRSRIAEREDSITLGRALKILTASRQTAIFFTFLVLLTLSLFMQEAILEPYGGQVFGMSIGETTLLNSYWGIGILIGYSATGFLVVPRLGKILTAKIGCILVSLCFLAIILAGLTQAVILLKSAMVLFGIAAGTTTIAAISLMLDLTLAETAGTFIGAWGLAQAMARGVATWVGGVLLDLGKWLLPTPFLAYSLVFALEAACVLLAIAVLNRVNVQEFQDNTRQAIATVMEGDLDS